MENFERLSTLAVEMKIINILETYFYNQEKIKQGIEQYKYYLIINDKKEANKVLDEVLKAQEEVRKILDINV